MSTMNSDAVVRWTSEFQMLVGKGLSATNAVCEIADSNPDLHEAFAEALQLIHAGDGEEIDAVQEANRRIAKRMRRGMSRPKAIAAVMREDPDLHAKYLHELGRVGEVDR
ncbi:hypothetical protein K2Y11_00595 [bacterium]|nr:hypothetical protein [bacterium]